jgi:hypothetical protein
VAALGSGAMGLVYSVLDRERGTHVALKGLKTPAAENILRFKAEFRALRDLEHPNLLRLGELFEEDGRWFFTMELVRGGDFLAYVTGVAHPMDAPSTGSSLRNMSGTMPRAAYKPPIEATRDKSNPSLDGSGERLRARLPAPEHGTVPVVYDETRLRAALAQLALALDTLHRAGMVHRDVKPSNVLVEPAGRVVLLDFGVAADLAGHALDREGTIVGTASHMAPEQAAGEAIEPAADWYAVGTMLYQALTGRLPFEGSMTDVLSRKVVGEVPCPPMALVPSTPADLNDLCVQLLAREPEARPSAVEFLRALGVAEPEAMLAPARHVGQTFVGRAHELAQIVEAFAASRESPVSVFVQGLSGIGKSATVNRALEQIRTANRSAIVLRGRCHENETVPYNAFDGVLDDLSRVLRNLDSGSGLADVRVSALLQVFPSLRSVGWLSVRAKGENASLPGPIELRQQAFDELRALVASLAATRPIVVVIDDLHWADAESVLLLGEWTRLPGAPKVLLLCTARPGADGARCAAIAAASGDVRVLTLEGLTLADARDLATRILDVRGDGARTVDEVLTEAGGHPMFLQELLEFSSEREASVAGGEIRPRLDDALLARAGRLPELAQRALEAVAVAGVPVREGTLARVLDVPRTALAPQLSVLRSSRLLRSAGARRGNTLETFHDRVREAVYEHLPIARRRELHHRLGELLEAENAPHEILFGHFDKAGDIVRAVGHAIAAAEVATRALAFERAASLYRFAIGSGIHDPDHERALRTAMGDALQKAGRPGEAAQALLAAVRTGTPSPDEAFELRRRGCEQYLMGGYLDEGIEASRAVLAEIGERRPDRYLVLVMLVLWHLFQLRVARLVWTSRPVATIPAAMQRRLDVYWSFSAGLSFLDAIRSGSFTFRGTLLAIRHGDDLRIVRAASIACMGVSAKGERKLAERLLAVVHVAGERTGTDLGRVYVELAHVCYEFMVVNDVRKVLEHCARARALWSATGRGGGWESDVIEQQQLWALAVQGEVKRLVEEAHAGVRFARATGNRFREFMIRTSFPQPYILRDAPQEGASDVRDAARDWAQPDGRFATPDYWSLKSRCMLAFYSGNVDDLRALDDEWRRFDRSALSLMELVAMESSDLRATVSLRLALEAKMRGDSAGLARHLARSRRLVRRIERSPLHFARGSVKRFRAASTLIEVGFDAARPLYEAALLHYEKDGSKGLIAGAHQVLGLFLGGDEGRSHLGKARAWAEQTGAKNPDRLLSMVAMDVGLLKT